MKAEKDGGGDGREKREKRGRSSADQAGLVLGPPGGADDLNRKAEIQRE